MKVIVKVTLLVTYSITVSVTYSMAYLLLRVRYTIGNIAVYMLDSLYPKSGIPYLKWGAC